MKLPIAIHYQDEVYTTATIKEATAGDIAKVTRAGSDGDIYTAFLTWAICTCASIDDVDDTAEIEKILRCAPFETIYAIAIWGMAKTRNVDAVEGHYKCPSCGNVIAHTGEFADSLFDLDKDFTEQESVEITLPQPVEIKNSKTGETIEKIEAITLKYPAINALIKAFRKYPDDESKVQFEVYKDSIKAVNGQPVDRTWQSSYGDLLFQKMNFNTINSITKKISEYSYGTIECACMKCKKRWKTKVDLTNFFDSEVE